MINIDTILSILDGSLNGIMAFRTVRDSQEKIVDLEWIFVNDRAGMLVDRNPRDLLGKKLLQEMPGNLEQGLFDQYKQVVDTGNSREFDIEYSDDNLNNWFHVQAVKIKDGLVVTFLDISKLKHFENELVRKEKLLTEAQDLANLGSWSWNLESGKVQWSDKVYDIFEASKSQIEPSYDYFLKKIVGDDRDIVVQTITRSIQHSKPYEISFRIKTGDTVKFLETRAVPKFDHENILQEYLGIIKDLTEEKAKEEALKKSQKKAKQMEKVAASERLARSIAHEIRNPLTNITLATEQLKDDHDPEDAQLFLDLISRNCGRIETLIQQLMDSAKQAEMQLSLCNINNILEEALTLAMDRIKLREVRVSKDFEMHMVEILMDRDHVRRAMLNIIINAIEAMESDGHLQLATQITRDECLVHIRDNGTGIAEDQLDHLFDPFYTGKKKGLGLGLTTSLNILNSHDANIEVDSELGQGTTFTISFPL